MIYATYIGLFLPLLSSLILMLSSFKIGRRTTGIIGCTSIFLSFVCFSLLLHAYNIEWLTPQHLTLFDWIPVKGIDADFTLYIDPLALVMTLIITGVGFLIHVYSVGYMEHDKDFARFFAYMNFFVFSMLLLVLAGHLLLLFVGWEGVGLASYFLIGFWYERPVAAAAAIKAFVVNRIGDLGLLLGLLLTFHLFGTGNIEEISKKATQMFAVGAPMMTLLTLLYFVGATGKSAQIPLQTWLPDAMAGPTPVSALIHAATMVTAGVYLVVRLHEIFILAPLTMDIIGIIGGVTALYASLCAVGQTDIKKVLAYSTVSQLGLMFLACGAGAFYAAIFHLTTHAFVKALLFLSAGNILHMAHEVTELEQMGGLAKKLPTTNWLFLIGVLALSGIPPLSAFFSKDFILEEEYLLGLTSLYYVGLCASILTGVYLTRAYYLAFQGQPRMERSLFDHLRDAPRVMLLPLFALAFLAIAGGSLGYAYGGISLLEDFLTGSGILDKIHNTGSLLTWETLVAVSGAFGGIIITWIACSRLSAPYDSSWKVLRKAFYIDEIYYMVFVLPLRGLATWIVAFFEPKVVDRIATIPADTTEATSITLQRTQSGQIRSYAAWMVIGTVVSLIYLVFEAFYA